MKSGSNGGNTRQSTPRDKRGVSLAYEAMRRQRQAWTSRVPSRPFTNMTFADKDTGEMIFQESDIDFSKLNDTEFEELCFDLLLRYNFHSLVWRQGGADSGRDIEARFTVTNPILGTYDELWFVECKHYTHGVPVDVLYSKVAWADAKQPQHLLIVTSSYVSNSARDWLQSLISTKPYHIHVLEGKQLKALLIASPQLVSKYFIDPTSKLLLEAITNWVIHYVLPDTKTCMIFYKYLALDKLSREELAFLWCVGNILHNESSQRPGELDKFFDPDLISSQLIERANCDAPVLTQVSVVNWDALKLRSVRRPTTFRTWVTASFEIELEGSIRPVLYCFAYDEEGEGLEVLFASDKSVWIHHIESQAQTIWRQEQLILRDASNRG